MASFASGKIEAYVGPPGLGAADDPERVIVDFIGGARSSLDIAVQEIDSRAIAQAILDARWRGVRVNIFLEQDYLRSDLVGIPPKAPTPKPGETAEDALRRLHWLKDETDLAVNREIFTALLAGVGHHDRASNGMRERFSRSTRGPAAGAGFGHLTFGWGVMLDLPGKERPSKPLASLG